MTQTIRQEITLPIAPAEVFATLTDASRFSAMTKGAPAEISTDEGGVFSVFGGMIVGRHVELVPGQRVVQAWRVKLWEPGVYSMVRFEFAAEGEGTRVTLTHSSFPEGQAEHLSKGWHDNYWSPLQAQG